MKKIITLALSLTVWSVIACCALALVNSFTAPIIEERANASIKAALTEIFPEAKKFDTISEEVFSSVPTITFDNVYLVTNGDKTLGITITATGPTYGSSTIMVGIDTHGLVKGISFIENTDTKGIGSKVLESTFTSQFFGKNAHDEFKVGSDVQGVSGATISSKGVSEILKTACISAVTFMANNGITEEN